MKEYIISRGTQGPVSLLSCAGPPTPAGPPPPVPLRGPSLTVLEVVSSSAAKEPSGLEKDCSDGDGLLGKDGTRKTMVLRAVKKRLSLLGRAS